LIYTEAKLSSRFIRVSDENGDSYDLNEELVAWMLRILKTLDDEAQQYEDDELGFVCEIDPDLLEDVKVLLGEVEEHLIEE
jgi:hypothetical protein